jgi:hypothetical protein
MSHDALAGKANLVLPPVAGLITCAVANSGSAGSLQLTTVGQTSVKLSSELQLPSSAGVAGGVGQFVEFMADGADVGLVFGATSAAVTSANAPNLSQTGTNTAGCCLRIPAGTYRTFYVTSATQWVGWIGASASNSNLRISVTSFGDG